MEDEGPQKHFTGKLILHDGTHAPIETWCLEEATIAGINWGDLDFTSSEAIITELTIKYNHVLYNPQPKPFEDHTNP